MFRGRNGWLLGLAAPVLVAAVRDLLNPSGLLRQLFLPPVRRQAGGEKRIRRNAEFSVIDEASDKAKG